MSPGDERLFLDYHLPEELIAQTPVEPRDSSRLLVVRRDTGALADHRFHELPDLLDPGDLLVLNDTRVIPARLFARRRTGGRVEILLLERRGEEMWEALISPLGRLKPGVLLMIEGEADESEVEFVGREGNAGLVRVADEAIIERHGRVPLPPYIRTPLDDPDRYQTVYAEQAGSAAAPTAGLHFTPTTLKRCRERGIELARLTLHVGVDTFRPLASDDIDAHVMHSEWYSVPEETVGAIAHCRERGGRVVAVGTTVTRVLETLGQHGNVCAAPRSGRTDIFIRPPYRFRLVDALVTNFHLPRTTLLLLVGAFAGTELIERAYEHAIERRYRFYSFGDAMLIV